MWKILYSRAGHRLQYLQSRKDVLYIRMTKTKNTGTHSYLILIALPQQQWLRERALLLLYMYMLVLLNFKREPTPAQPELNCHIGVVLSFSRQYS
jgi:hypothetical protein